MKWAVRSRPARRGWTVRARPARRGWGLFARTPGWSRTGVGDLVVGCNNISGWGAASGAQFVALGVKRERREVAYDGGVAAAMATIDASIAQGLTPLVLINSPDATPLSAIDPATYAANAVAIIKAVRAAYPQVTLFEVINEPDLKGNPATDCNPARYAAIYKATKDAAAAAGLGAAAQLLFYVAGDVQPLGAAWSQVPLGGGWLALALQAVPSLRIDAAACHPYGALNNSSTAPGAAAGWMTLDVLRRDALRQGIDVPWYVTEYGTIALTTDAPALAAQQAAVTRVLDDAHRLYRYVAGVYWFVSRDYGAGKEWGLADAGGAAKPAATTLQQWIAAQRAVIAR
ncbi:MAG: hypothetical protein JWR63_4294 [Conexibacter sp.]|nr:hypothetical protein [Conexibacter sp.]